jgi:hypothetical protein
MLDLLVALSRGWLGLKSRAAKATWSWWQGGNGGTLSAMVEVGGKYFDAYRGMKSRKLDFSMSSTSYGLFH